MTYLIPPTHDNLPFTSPYLPPNYNFEINKTLRTIKKYKCKIVTLQFPDGLLRYAPVIIDLITVYTDAICIILNDVVYGACCVDDSSIKSDLLIHYGHSCLVPVTEMSCKVLYVFVDIQIDVEHLYNIIKKQFIEETEISVIGTIQFNSSMNRLKMLCVKESNERCKNEITSYEKNENEVDRLTCEISQNKSKNLNISNKKNENDFNNNFTISKLNNNTEKSQNCTKVLIPQIKPLSKGEVLGCTSPKISSSIIISIGDGRFHLESVMINNPTKTFYKYCPFNKVLTREFYNYTVLLTKRQHSIHKAMTESKTFGIILGSLGKQGNKTILNNIKNRLKNYKLYIFMMEEITPRLLDRYPFIDSYVQISCPRLSTDWSDSFSKPLLSPFEVFYEGGDYKLDYYSNEGYGPHKNYNNVKV